MRGLFCFLLCTFLAHSLDLYINSGRENSSNYAVLNLVHTQPFLCQEVINKESEVEKIICNIQGEMISRFAKSDTLFFKIEPIVRPDEFALIIYPKHKIKLFNEEFDLKHGALVPVERNMHSTKWQILGYENELPFFNRERNDGLNFPISFKDSYPSIGVLDFNLKPMSDDINTKGDADYYLRIQSLIAKDSFQEASSVVDEMLAAYPSSIFKRDALYYKIHSMYGLNVEENLEDIIDFSKAWLKAYPTDIHVPEVFYILANTYAKMNFFEEAKHYYDILFSQYKGDKFELLARLSYGENLYQRGDRKIAPDLYASVLNQTQDVEIASQAALKLADFYKKTKDYKQAENYLKIIYDANPKFFAKDIEQTYTMLQDWAENGVYMMPAMIMEYLLHSYDKEDTPLIYHDLLKDTALWYDKAKNLPKAHQYYQEFLTRYKNDEDKERIKELDDRLLLDYDEQNATKRLEHYDYVIKEYAGKEESKKALQKKAQTLFDLKDYQAIFGLRDELENNNTILLQSVGELTKMAFDKDNCKDASFYGNLYSDSIPLDEPNQLKLFDCLYQNKQYNPAQAIAKKWANQGSDVASKQEWLYRLGWVEYDLQNYPKAALASRDASTINSNPAHFDSLWVLFMSLHKLNRDQEAFELLPALEEKLANDVRMIEVYRIMLLDAMARKDDVATKIYAQKIMNLQMQYQKFEYSPWVELSLIEVLIKEGQFKEAQELLMQAKVHASAPNDMIQIFYLQGFLYQKQNNTKQAIEAYQSCINVNIQSPWKGLCQDAKKLLDPKEASNGK